MIAALCLWCGEDLRPLDNIRLVGDPCRLEDLWRVVHASCLQAYEAFQRNC